MAEDTEHLSSEITHPLDTSFRENFTGPRYKAHRDQWDKANDRLLDDPDGALTAARTLLETTCKQILDDLKMVYDPAADLPKLYNVACNALGTAPGTQVDPAFRAVFSSTYQIVRSVSEIRNKYGDAHGIPSGSVRPSKADSELAVHLAGAVSCFLVRRYESHLSATRRLTADGQAILWFDKSLVWRLVDHATNSPKTALWFGEDVGRCLMLVGDAGIYLMSNGSPQILFDGTLAKKKRFAPLRALVATAEGCDASADFEAWWPIHNAIDNGNDFSLPIPVEEFRNALEGALLSIIMIADPDRYIIMSDVQFERQFGSTS